LVTGGVALIGGDPGIGKSTLLLQALAAMSARGDSVLDISGDESGAQIALRAKRLGIQAPDLEVLAEIQLEKLLATIKALPEIVCQPYAPKITKPTELKRDFGKLLLFVKQHKLQVGKYQAKSINI
jgi:hypothetical protein